MDSKFVYLVFLALFSDEKIGEFENFTLTDSTLSLFLAMEKEEGVVKNV